MSHTASLRVAMLALATCACALAISPRSTQAAPAATCADAPKPAAPEGRHWRYHLDRTTNRKCWYLSAQGGRKTRSAAMPVPATEPEERTAAPPVSAAGIKHLTQPFEDARAQAPAPAQVLMPAQPSAAPSIDAAPTQAVVQAAPAPEASAAANGSDQAQRVDTEAQPGLQNTVAVAAQPAPVQAAVQAPVEPAVAPNRSASPDAGNMKMLPFALGALAAALLAAGAILFASSRRRRQDKIVRIVDLNVKPRLPKAPNLADWSDLSDAPRGHDDGRERQRTPQRRQAA